MSDELIPSLKEDKLLIKEPTKDSKPDMKEQVPSINSIKEEKPQKEIRLVDPIDTAPKQRVQSPKEEKPLQQEPNLEDEDEEMKLLTGSLTNLDLDEVERLINQYNEKQALRAEAQNREKQTENKSPLHEVQPDKSKKTLEHPPSLKIEKKSSQRYSGDPDNEEIKVESFAPEENSSKVTKENPLKLAPIDQKFTLAKKDPLPLLKNPVVSTLGKDEQKNPTALQHTLKPSKDGESNKQQSSIDTHENKESIQPVYASAKNTNKQEDQEFEIDDFELP